MVLVRSIFNSEGLSRFFFNTKNSVAASVAQCSVCLDTVTTCVILSWYPEKFISKEVEVTIVGGSCSDATHGANGTPAFQLRGPFCWRGRYCVDNIDAFAYSWFSYRWTSGYIFWCWCCSFKVILIISFQLFFLIFCPLSTFPNSSYDLLTFPSIFIVT